jgi:starvation-inducible outer membrane lipoprotein
LAGKPGGFSQEKNTLCWVFAVFRGFLDMQAVDGKHLAFFGTLQKKSYGKAYRSFHLPSEGSCGMKLWFLGFRAVKVGAAFSASYDRSNPGALCPDRSMVPRLLAHPLAKSSGLGGPLDYPV